ncbi:PspA/IM30 family protein [Streptomyces sp. PmtG]
MTSSSPSRAAARAVAAALLLWCGLPGPAAWAHATTVESTGAEAAHATSVARAERVVPPGEAASGGDDDGVAGDLVLPVVAVGVAGAFAAVAYRRRRRRFTTRTTPGGRSPKGPQATALPELDARAGRLLVEMDDAVRTSAEELAFATAGFGEPEVRPFARALAQARAELTAAFRLRRRLDDDASFEDDATRRRMLDEIVTRCAEAGRQLDAEAAAFDELRSLEGSTASALEWAETVFRRANARTMEAESALKELRAAYAPTAIEAVVGNVEQAKDRLVFATVRLNGARACADVGDSEAAVIGLRAAEGAIDQAGTFAAAVVRLAGDLARADGWLPGALDGAEADLAEVRELLAGPGAGAELRGRAARAESVVAEVRRAAAAGAYDPVDALRRVGEADAALVHGLAGARRGEDADTRSRSLLDRAVFLARGAVAAAGDYVTTHRGAVGLDARARLRGGRTAAGAGGGRAGRERRELPGGRSTAGRRAGPAGAGGRRAGRAGVRQSVRGCRPRERRGRGGGRGDSRRGRTGRRRAAALRRAPDPRASRRRRTDMTRRTLLGRVVRLSRADLRSLIDHAEDPRTALEELIGVYTDVIGEAGQADAAAVAVADARPLERDRWEDGETAAAWGARARDASRRADALRREGRDALADRCDGLAKAALGRQLRWEGQARELEEVLASRRDAAEALADGLDSLRIKLTELRTRRDQLLAHARAARVRVPLTDGAPHVNALAPGPELDRFAEVLRRADGPDGAALAEEFAPVAGLRGEAEVEARLAALKATT